MTQPFMPKGIKGFQKGHSVPKELREKLSKLRKNKPSSRKGVKVSTSTKKKLKDYYQNLSPEEKKAHSERMRAINLGSKQFPETIAKRVASRKGYRHSEETKHKIREAQRGEKSYQWKGSAVGYSALHKWLYKILGKPGVCEHCDTDKNVEWANRSHEYHRIKSDWIALCRKCHIAYDKGRNDVKRIFLSEAK